MTLPDRGLCAIWFRMGPFWKRFAKPPPPYQPTADEIAEACRLIQATWSTAEKLRRDVRAGTDLPERRCRVRLHCPEPDAGEPATGGDG